MNNKEIVENKIIELLLDGDNITRPFLNEYFDIRPATLLEIIDGLKNKGIIAEPERKGKKTGRKASPVCLNEEYAYIAGLDFQINSTSGIVMDLRKNVKARFEIQSSKGKDIKSGREEIKKVIENLKQQLGDTWDRVKGIGFADPGLVNTEKGLSIKAVNISGWNSLNTSQWLKENFGLDSIIYPSPMVRTYIEYQNTYPDYPKSLFHMELSSGIGGGFIKDGNLFTGDSFCGMEIGHIVVDPNGPLCQCGNKGCLEAVAGKSGIWKKVKELISNGVQTELSTENFSIPFFIKCVKDRDKAACGLAHDICNNIGLGLASVVALLNPSVIVFSGELSALDEFLVSVVKRTISLHCFPSAVEALDIRVSKCDQYANALGSALLMRKKILLESTNSSKK